MDLRVWIQMNKEKLPVVAGRAAHASGNAHEFTSEEARRAGARSHINDDDRRGRSSSSGTRKRDRYGRFTSD